MDTTGRQDRLHHHTLRSYRTFMGQNYKSELITSNIYSLLSVNISGSSFFFQMMMGCHVFCYITKLLAELLY